MHANFFNLNHISAIIMFMQLLLCLLIHYIRKLTASQRPLLARHVWRIEIGNIFLVCCHNKQRNLINNLRRCTQKRHKESDKIWLGKFLQVKLCLFNWNCITWTYWWNCWESFFAYKCKFSLAFLYLANTFINQLKTKLNGFLYRMVSNTGIILILQIFLSKLMSPPHLKKCLQKSFICWQDSMAAVSSVICMQNCNGSQRYHFWAL